MLKRLEARDDGIVLELTVALFTALLNPIEDGTEPIHHGQHAAYDVGGC